MKEQNLIFDVIFDALIDTAKMAPFLFVAYLVIEYVERRHSQSVEKVLAGTGKLGFISGAALGLLPQCGFSAMAASLYSSRAITLGTLIAVFVATSDEAIPILLSIPDMAGSLILLLATKLVVAIIAGFCIDFVLRRYMPESLRGGYLGSVDQVDCHEHVESDSILMSAVKHTLGILAFVLVFNLGFGFLAELVGNAAIGEFVQGWGILQPVIAGLIGLVPNCASSILLTQLYASGTLSFGGMLAGLCTGAGAGLAVLLRANKSVKQNVFIVVVLYAIGVLAGLVAVLVMP